MGSRARRLEKALSNRMLCRICDGISLAFFAVVILLPTIYVFSYVFTGWEKIFESIFADPIAGSIRWESMKQSIILSFEIAAAATLIDIAIGLPMAVILARYEFRGKEFIDTLIDLPMAVPSSALGFSVYLFWASSAGLSAISGGGGLLSPGPALILLAHVAFTYPYIVRSLRGLIESVSVTYEHAARTLGAVPFTVFRTITSPLVKPGLIAGAILAFTRSLGETGATLIVAGIYETAPIKVVSWYGSFLIPEAALLSMTLTVIACTCLGIMKFVSERFGIPIRRVWPGPERFLSGRVQRGLRDLIAFSSFLGIVLLPSAFTVPYVVRWWGGSPFTGRFESGVYYQVFIAPDMKWRALWESLLASITVALLATLINLVMGTAMAVIIVRRGWGRLNSLLDALIDIPLAIPTSALGFSVYLFWGPRGMGLLTPGFWLILLVHVAFTYPYVVRTVIAALRGVPRQVEDAARTLGAPSFTVFRTVILPIVKPGLLSAAILAFTRSLGETGATIMVMGTVRTIPVLVVEWVEAMAFPAASFACVVLVLISYILLLTLRYVTRG